MSLAAVNQICVIHEAMNGCKILKFIIGLLENVNIAKYFQKKYDSFLGFSLSLSIPAKTSMKNHWQQFCFEPIISVVAFFFVCRL